jgi:anti-sigma factor RsiW
MGGGKTDMRLNCKTVRASLPAYADGGLDTRTSGRIAHHLASCHDCSAALELERSIIDGLSSLPRLQCPGRVEESVWRSVRAAGSGGEEAPAWKRSWVGRPSWKPAFAVIALLALAVGIWEWSRTPGRKPAIATAQEVEWAGTALRWSLAFTAQTLRQSEKQALEAVFADQPVGAVPETDAKLPLHSGGTKP